MSPKCLHVGTTVTAGSAAFLVVIGHKMQRAKRGKDSALARTEINYGSGI